jgi:hypothetical protein
MKKMHKTVQLTKDFNNQDSEKLIKKQGKWNSFHKWYILISNSGCSDESSLEEITGKYKYR